MATVKILLRESKANEAGEAPICIRITKNRVTKFVFLNYRVHPDDWNDIDKCVLKTNPLYNQINNYIAVKKAEATGIAVSMETSDKYTLPGKIKEQIMGKVPESFYKYAERYLLELESNKQIGTYRKTKSIIDKMKRYTGTGDLLFDDITVTWLKAYEMNLRTVYKNRINTINSNFRIIKRIINAAIVEDLIVDDKTPFKKFKLTTEKSKKDYLTEQELMLIESAEIENGSTKDHHRNMYVFSAYAGGLRISDMLMLQWKHFSGDKITVDTKKTGSIVAIKLPSKAMQIIQQYKTERTKPEEYIFPFFNKDRNYQDEETLYNAISLETVRTNNDLRELAKQLQINKKVSFHSARHTFATRALMKGMRIEYVSKLLGHADISTTQIYAKIISEELDKAMEVFN